MTYVAPVILHETAPNSLRKRSGLLFQLFIVLGSAAAVFATSKPHETDWRIGLSLPAIPCVIILFLLLFVPESPLSRIRHVKTREEAIRILVESLSCVREGDVEEEAHALFRWFRESQPTTQTSWSDVLNSKNELFRLTCVVVFLQFGQQATCINAFLMFSGSIWKQLEFDDPVLFNIAWQITNVLAVSYVIIRTVLHDDDFVGRRARLLSRASVMGPSLILVGLMYRIGDGDADNNSTYVSYVLLCFYAICYQITWGFSFREDIWGVFSQSEREKVTILALVIQSLTNFVVVASAPSLYTWSVEAMFYTFGTFVCVCVCVVGNLTLECIITGTLNCFVFLLMYLSMVRGWKDVWTLNEAGSLTLRRHSSSNRRRRGRGRREHRKNQQSTGWGQYLNLSSPDHDSERRSQQEERIGDVLR